MRSPEILGLYLEQFSRYRPLKLENRAKRVKLCFEPNILNMIVDRRANEKIETNTISYLLEWLCFASTKGLGATSVCNVGLWLSEVGLPS